MPFLAVKYLITILIDNTTQYIINNAIHNYLRFLSHLRIFYSCNNIQNYLHTRLLYIIAYRYYCCNYHSEREMLR